MPFEEEGGRVPAPQEAPLNLLGLAEKVVITSAKSSQGSGFGVSSDTPFLGCPRRSYLERISPQGTSSRVFNEDGTRKLDRYKRPLLDEAKIGVLTHDLLRHYHMGLFVDGRTVLEYQDGNEDLEWNEALRLFRHYRAMTKPDAYGKVLTCEEPFEVGCKECHLGKECERTRGICDRALHAENLLGKRFFTGRLDMKTRVPDDFGLSPIIPEPGLYIVDTKVKNQQDGNLMDVMMHSQQFDSYMMAARDRGEDVKGLIANVIIRTQEVKLMQICVPFPDPAHQQAVRDQNTLALVMRRAFGENHANPARCFDWHRTCPFLDHGCDRTNPHLSRLTVVNG